MSLQNAGVWVCSVCGYVHRGLRPPESCPVCGATADLFEPQKMESVAASSPAVTQWRCLNCEYIHSGSVPPEVCPVCGAGADSFEACATGSGAAASGGVRRRVIIVGAGIAGVSAAEAVRQSSAESEILLLSKEDERPYYRLNLTRYLAGEIAADQLDLKPADWYDRNRIELRQGTELTGIDLAGRAVQLRDGAREGFDRLILTAGSHPFVPPFPGVNLGNVTVLRTRTDADRILSAVGEGVRCVCVGGGLLGLETAGALARRGAVVTLLEGGGWLLPRQINERAARILEASVGGLGIRLLRHAKTRELFGDAQVRGVLLESGAVLPADLVVIATGVRPNSYLARQAGLHVNQGILVDDFLRSTHPDVFAAGDVAEHRGMCYGAWGPAQFQGAIAGLNAADGKAEFGGIPRSNLLKVLGIDLFSIGRVFPEDASYDFMDAESGGHYCGFVFRDSRMVGAILLGETRLSAAVKSCIEKGRDCSDLLRLRPAATQVLDWLAG